MHPLNAFTFGLGIAALALVAPAHAADGIETPDYEVVASQSVQDAPGKTIELRRYAPMIVAEVTVEAESGDAASSKGFMPLAGYIFGGNAPGGTIDMTAPMTTAPTEGGVPSGEGETIAMTAPVTTARADDATNGDAGSGTSRYTVRFMMPSQYTLDTLPEPLDPNVTLMEAPERTLVALRFGGARTADRVAGAEAAVTDYIEGAGLEPTGPFIVAGYDGPQTPTSEKRWEVQRPVASVEPAAPADAAAEQRQ